MIRDIKNTPFQWQDKNTMRLIREAFQEERGNKLAFAIAVYVCMTEIASNKQSDVFIFTQSELAKMTGLSLNTVRQIIEAFERLKIIKRKKHKKNGFLLAYIYELLAPPSKPTLAKNTAQTHHCKSAKFDKFPDAHGVSIDAHNDFQNQFEQQIEESIEESIEKFIEENVSFSFSKKNETKNSTSQNFQKSFIESELPKNNTNAQPAQENASNAIPASHSPIPKRNPKQKAETFEERVFREGYYAFANRAIEFLVAQGCVQEEPSRYWRWAKRLNKTDKRITVDVLKHCFNHYVSQRSGTGWRSRAKSFKQFVAAFNEIFQSLSTLTTTNHESHQAIISDTKLQRDIVRSEEWFAVAATIAAQRACNH